VKVVGKVLTWRFAVQISVKESTIFSHIMINYWLSCLSGFLSCLFIQTGAYYGEDL